MLLLLQEVTVWQRAVVLCSWCSYSVWTSVCILSSSLVLLLVNSFDYCREQYSGKWEGCLGTLTRNKCTLYFHPQSYTEPFRGTTSHHVTVLLAQIVFPGNASVTLPHFCLPTLWFLQISFITSRMLAWMYNEGVGLSYFSFFFSFNLFFCTVLLHNSFWILNKHLLKLV